MKNSRQIMRKLSLSAASFIVSILFVGQSASASQTNFIENEKQGSVTGRVLASYLNAPLSFEVNHGQADTQVKYLARGNGYNLFLTPSETVFTLFKSQAQDGRMVTSKPPAGKPAATIATTVRIRLHEANRSPLVSGKDELPYKSNYFTGSDPKKWRTNVATFAKVKYQGVYPGIDVVYYGTQGKLENDYIVAPGADPKQIILAYEGVESLSVDQEGDLILKTNGGELRQHRPQVYQEINGVKQEIQSRYILKEKQKVGFWVGNYDASKALVIDPVLAYSTYLGGSGNNIYDSGSGIAVDASGNAYVTGTTWSVDFPTTANAFQPTSPNGHVAFISKINSTGNSLVYSTFLGGLSEGMAITVDSTGNAYVTGYAMSDFPNTPGALQFTGPSAFVAKLDATGSALVYSALLGGQYGNGIAVDTVGNAYVAGYTGCGFTTTPGAYQSNCTGGIGGAFVSKLNPTGSERVYSTYLSGSSGSEAYSVALDTGGNAYVAGWTTSADFPTTMGAFLPALASSYGGDAFVSKLNPEGSALVYSTFLGGDGFDSGRGIAVDASGNAYVTGYSQTTNFPITPGAYKNTNANFTGAFVTKLNPAGTALVYSAALGGKGRGIAVDAKGNAFVTGEAAAANGAFYLAVVQTTADAFQTNSSGAFLTKLNASGNELIYSTHLGGSIGSFGTAVALDSQGNAYITGGTAANDFPTRGFEFQRVLAGSQNTFVAKFSFATIISLSVAGIQPNAGGDTGQVTVLIIGDGFEVGATVKLVRAGQADIPGTPVTVGADGRTIKTTFDLVNKARGLWDVVVTNPGNTSFTLPQGFTIEEGRGANVWVNFICRDTIVIGRKQNCFLVYGNAGNIDSELVLFNVTLPIGVTSSVMNAPGLVTYGETEEGETLIMIDPEVGAGATGSAIIGIGLPSTTNWDSPVCGSVWFSTDFSNVLMADELINRAELNNNNVSVPGNSCPMENPYQLTGCTYVYGLNQSVLNKLYNLGNNSSCENNIVLTGGNEQDKHKFREGSCSHVRGFKVDLRSDQCLIDDIANKYTKVNKPTFGTNQWKDYNDGTEFTLEGDHLDVKVPSDRNGNCQKDGNGNRKCLMPVQSADPNDKVGPLGVGETRYISDQIHLPYTIFFENLESATASAQEVVITDHLDAEKLDLTTLSLGPISFGDKVITPISGLREFTTEVDLRPAKNLLVRINANLDNDTGILTWRFKSIDPDTGELPDDPMLGFLPPNVNSPEGQGSVFFTVMPKNGLPTGTEIRNTASIIFDVNPPMDTPTWFNTLDNSKPSSHALPLPATQPAPSFNVQWAGTDNGSGVMDYSIFVSEDGGTFDAWLINTPASSGTFHGQSGKSYSFYSIARDRVLNIEKKPGIIEASTQVLLDETPPETIKVISGTTGTNGWYTTDISLTLKATDSGSGVKEIRYRLNNGSEVVVAGNSTTKIISSEGSHILTYYSVDNAGNIESLQTIELKIDKTVPIISISGISEGASYPLGAVPPKSYSTIDDISGVMSEFVSESGGNINEVGTFSYTVTARDYAGNLSTLKVNYNVVYKFGGFLSPLNLDNTFRLGSTVPVRFQLTDINGLIIPSTNATVSLQKYSGGLPIGNIIDGISTSDSGAGNRFRFSDTDNLYIFNLNTKALSKGIWQIIITLDDGTVKTTFFSIR